MKAVAYALPAISAAAHWYSAYHGASKLRDHLDQGFKSSRSRTVTQVKRKRKRQQQDMADYSMIRRQHVAGRKPKKSVYMDKLTSSTVIHQVERFSKVSDPAATVGTNRGSTWLSYGDNAKTYTVWDGTTDHLTQQIIEMPIHLYNLSTTSCNPSTLNFPNGNVGWKLGLVGTAGAINRVVFAPILGWSRTQLVNPNSYPVGTETEWTLEDNEGSSTAGVDVGRSALLEWTEARTLFYGKKSRPTHIKCMFVTFPDESYAPDYEYYDNDDFSLSRLRTVGPQAEEYWKSRVQPLINNPCTVTKRVASSEGHRAMKILSSVTIKIPPKETTDADSDPFQRYHRWFNKWYRKVDYSKAFASETLDIVGVQDPQQYPIKGDDIPENGSCKFPNQLKGSVYFMVTSYQPDKENIAVDESGPTNAVTASYDFLFRKSTGLLANP